MYESYEGPVLFTCVNAAGHRYLVTWAITTRRHELWLLAAISVARLQLLRAGAVDLRDAFMKTEDAMVARVRVPVVAGRARWHATDAGRTPESWLPAADVLLCD